MGEHVERDELGRVIAPPLLKGSDPNVAVRFSGVGAPIFFVIATAGDAGRSRAAHRESQGCVERGWNKTRLPPMMKHSGENPCRKPIARPSFHRA